MSLDIRTERVVAAVEELIEDLEDYPPQNRVPFRRDKAKNYYSDIMGEERKLNPNLPEEERYTRKDLIQRGLNFAYNINIQVGLQVQLELARLYPEECST